jgi:hypothetical protein
VNDPANYFFSFNGTQNTQPPKFKDVFPGSYKEAGVSNTVKVVHIPKEKNHIQLRIQNIADLYDSNSKTATVDLPFIADALWAAGN